MALKVTVASDIESLPGRIFLFRLIDGFGNPLRAASSNEAGRPLPVLPLD